MYACDFEYDGLCLSDFGFIICTFGGSSDMETFSVGSRITFNTVSRHNGKKYGLVGTSYDECIQATFQICKDPQKFDDLIITNDESRDIVRWLNRDEFLPFQIIHDDDEHETCKYEASFNIDKILVGDVLYGLELTMETNKPFGNALERVVKWDITDVTKEYVFHDMSDRIGYIYPSMTITCSASGKLSIYNSKEDCLMEIDNCEAGEVISIDGDTLIISSSNNSHKVYDDFNFEYFRIGNTYNERANRITVSLPCILELRYYPIIKDSPN